MAWQRDYRDEIIFITSAAWSDCPVHSVLRSAAYELKSPWMATVKLIMFKDDAHSEAAAIVIDANSIKIEGHRLFRCTTK